MSYSNFFRSGCAIAVLAVTSQAALAGVFVPPTVSGTTPSGLQWTTVATGSSLPVRSTTAAANGLPGAVVYWDTITGRLQLDPNGWDLNALIISYSSGTGTISDSTPGPFTYATGTALNSLSGATGVENQKTFPAAISSSLDPTTFPARLGLSGNPLGSTLASVGDPGNIASTGAGGYWNLKWSFPTDLINSGSVSSMAVSSFKTYNLLANANSNILGYGSQLSVFQYGINGVVGNQVGAVIPVVPEPSTFALAGVGIAAAGGINYRRQMRRKQQALREISVTSRLVSASRASDTLPVTV